MRRLALLFVGGAVWLFLAAIPVLADGGPHVASINSGTTGINSDNCAGCHRAHTAQGAMLLVADEADICLTCHGATGTGATTDVESGIQYTLAVSGQVRGGTVLGALRGGGFLEARIDSGNAARLSYQAGSQVKFLPKVPVRSSGQAVTSAHLALSGSGLTAPGVAWGNGPFDGSAGPQVDLTCASCHNPHGNGNYRILNPIPDPADAIGATTPAFSPAASPVAVKDAPLPSAGDVRNYTVIQVKGTPGTNSTYLLYASQVLASGYSNTTGDYFHREVPWNSSSGALDAPNGIPANRPAAGETAFNTQITAWCSTCHNRYLSTDANEDTGDQHYRYRHSTTTDRACTTCHVAHGSNAQMIGIYSSTMPFPDGSTTSTGDSRLLKIDDRGTCQACHDPTGTIASGTFNGPTPSPLTP